MNDGYKINDFDFGYQNAIVSKPDFKLKHKYPIYVMDYRSLYPECWEPLVYSHGLDLDTFFKYKEKFPLVMEIFNKKMSMSEYKLIESKLCCIVKEIVNLESKI